MRANVMDLCNNGIMHFKKTTIIKSGVVKHDDIVNAEKNTIITPIIKVGLCRPDFPKNVIKEVK